MRVGEQVDVLRQAAEGQELGQFLLEILESENKMWRGERGAGGTLLMVSCPVGGDQVMLEGRCKWM